VSVIGNFVMSIKKVYVRSRLRGFACACRISTSTYSHANNKTKLICAGAWARPTDTAATAVDSMARGACAYDTPLTGFLSTDCAVN